MSDQKKRLIICGNGFDAHHGLGTTYFHYKHFLEEKYPRIAREYEKFSGLTDSGKGFWHNIEESLEIDYEAYMGNLIEECYPDVLNNDSDSRWYDISVELDSETEFIKLFTGQCFYEFLSGVSFENRQKSPIVERFIDEQSRFLTFNYTDTLNKLYHIERNKILHIHGALKDVSLVINPPIRPDMHGIYTMEQIESMTPPDTPAINNDLIRSVIQFGAVGITANQVEQHLYKRYSDDDFFGASIEGAIRGLIDFVEMSTKDLNGNILNLVKYIENEELQEVVVMGHSLLSADELYYREVLVPRLKDCKWTFMNYTRDSNCIKEIEKFISKYELKNVIIIPW